MDKNLKAQKKETIVTYGDAKEKGRRGQLLELLRNCPIPDEEMPLNLGLFLTPQTLSRVLFMDFLYRQILDLQGVVMEFGCRWGQNLSLFSSMRGIYEPFNRLRKVIGLDTFEGLPSVLAEDGQELSAGMYSVTSGYEQYLNQLLEIQEQESPMAHLRKFELIKGDASTSLIEYLEKNPETVVALAYFDMDLYKPTYDCLKILKEHLTIGSVIGFDELNDHLCPGETRAVKEVFGLNNYSLRRFPYNSRTSYMIFDHP